MAPSPSKQSVPQRSLQTQHTQHGISEMRVETPGPLASVPWGRLLWATSVHPRPRESAVQALWVRQWTGLLSGWQWGGVALEVLNGLS